MDNDGDGVPDSVWVDLGMPVRSTADGRLYKPLFAILCVDLDGRLNLNAHGSLAQTGDPGYAPYGQQYGMVSRSAASLRVAVSRTRRAGKVSGRRYSTSLLLRNPQSTLL